MSRYYTIEEANAALPRLEALVTELMATHNRIMAMRPEIEGVLTKSNANSGSAAASRMVMDFGRVEATLRKINAMSVEVKDVSSGLCDFTALHEGREIYLCWRFGEPRVEWWHELHTGLSGRRHVDELA